MLEFLINALSVKTLTMLFAAVAAAATVLTLAMPLVFVNPLDKRMRAVALEREKIRQRERERMSQENQKVKLRQTPKQYVQTIVDRFNLSKWVGQEEARLKLVQAGYRGQAPYVTYLFVRMMMPVACFLFALVYLFVVLKFDQPATIKLGICIGAAYIGMQLPFLLLRNKIQRRQLSIKRAFPDTLDLLLICVESGMSIEAAFRKVSVEVGTQSVPLAEELTLTTAELSYLSAGSTAGLREPCQADGSRWREICLHGPAAVRTLWHAARDHAARDGPGKPRHAHVGGGEKGGRAAAQAHCADDPLFPAVLFIVILGPAAIKVMALQ
jgi:tight adherence protein C